MHPHNKVQRSHENWCCRRKTTEWRGKTLINEGGVLNYTESDPKFEKELCPHNIGGKVPKGRTASLWMTALGGGGAESGVGLPELILWGSHSGSATN